jgi:transcriptional regulator with XRE-family HTH domain
MNDQRKTAASELRRIRKECRFTVRGMARNLNLTPSYWSKCERGLVVAGVETYESACALLGIHGEQRLHLFQRLGVIDAETRDLFERLYRQDPEAVKAGLKSLAEQAS